MSTRLVRAAAIDSAPMKIGIVGLGYVGLPLAVAFAEAGHDVVGLDADARKVEASNRARATSRTSRRAPWRRSPGACTPTAEPRRPRLLRRGDHLRADAAHRLARARPHLPARRRRRRSPGSCSRASWSCSSRPPTPARPASACRRSSRSPGCPRGTDFHLAFSPERIDPGRTDYTVRTTPKLVGGLTEACSERARELYELICEQVVVLSEAGGGRALEAPGEHLPLGQHRLRQRAGPALRPARDRRLGGDRRGRDQAVRLHALRPRARHGRPLPADRPLLSRLQGARARLLPGVHRAGGEGQPGPARLLRRARSSAR